MGYYNSFKVLNDRGKYIFDIVQKKGPITKSELIGITKIKLTTLNRDIQILLDKKIIIETDIGESTGGRKPSLYDVNPSGFYIIGIDISRTYTRIVITNLKLKIIEEELLNNEYKFEDINKIIPNLLKKLFIKLDIEKSKIVGVGIGIVGGFNSKPLFDTLSTELGAQIFIDNGANAAAIGEYFFGSGKGMKNMAYINCGVGIRTGIISDGVLIPSINNSEDAFGHMIIDANGELCSCGNYGCVESYVSISNITKEFIEKIKENKVLDINKEVDSIDYKDVCSLAEIENEIAINLIKKSALYFGIALSNYMKLFNPQLIILSGPLMQNSKLFYSVCKEVAFEKCHIENNNIQFSNGGYYKDKSIAVGACAMVIQKLQN